MPLEEPYLRNRLKSGCRELGLELTESTQDQLLFFLEQLHKWNKAFNLSGIKDPSKMLTHHLLDSLSVIKFFSAQNVADIGTGAGLPGLPLAICKPETNFFLIDSNSKKTRFIFQTSSLLGLKNIHVVNSRAEEHRMDIKCDIVTSRAFASLEDFVNSAAHLVGKQPESRLLALKGKMPKEEIQAIPKNFYMHDCTMFSVPGVDAERCIIDIRRR